MSSNVTQFVPAVNHGGRMTGKPTLLVVHDAETPLQRGYALSIARNWFGKPQPAGRESSAHYMTDPGATVQMVHTYDIAWHAGPNANGFTLGYEQAGYASYTRAQWTTPDGISQMNRLAAILAEDAKFYGVPVRLATDAQIRDAAHGHAAGICFHRDVTRVLHGTTHTDPGRNYPKDLLIQKVLNAAGIKPAQTWYVVRDGDTLSKIAQRYKTTVARIDALNGSITNVNKIRTGQRIRVK